jgi:cyclic pyranopterin monophosphate synthase
MACEAVGSTSEGAGAGAERVAEGGLTHLDEQGRARMVDVGDKPVTQREALAQALVHMQAETLRRLMASDLDKGDALAAARIAGIMAAKETSRLIPLCHPLALSHVSLELSPQGDDTLVILATVRTADRTGVEMEALTAATVAALTIYDMAKAIDREMLIGEICLLHKHGGRSKSWSRVDAPGRQRI